jgi:hypothetical protein
VASTDFPIVVAKKDPLSLLCSLALFVLSLQYVNPPNKQAIMSMSSQAARGLAGGPSSTTLAVVALGSFCIANPEKAYGILHKALATLSDGNGASSNSNGLQPIVIHAGGPQGGSYFGGGSGGSITYVLVQLGVGAGLCWGSYALLVQVLPEAAKNMLPVSQATFKTAVTSLGKGLIHVRESLSKEILSLLHMQTDLQSKQDETHEQVLYVQDQVSDVHDDLHGLQGSMDDCQRALRSTDQRTTYIAKGIRLVTQGMTAMLPPDDELRREIDRFARSDVQGSTEHTGTTTTGRNDRPVRNKPEVLDKTTTQPQDGATRSRSSSSRASRESRRAERRQANGSFRKASNNNNNYQPDSPSDCHTSVSSGTPLRHIVIPSRRSKGSSPVVSSPAVQELDEVRALLASMEQAQATVM